MSLARAVLSGVVESDPEKRFTSNGVAVVNFNMTLQGPGIINSRNPAHLEQPVQLRVVCWRALAEMAEAEVRKGQSLVVEGRLLTTSFQAPDGSQKKGIELEAHTIQVVEGPTRMLIPPPATGGGRQAGSAGGGGGYASPPQPSAAPAMPQAAGYGPQPQRAAAVAPSANESLRVDDLFTDDDIPF